MCLWPLNHWGRVTHICVSNLSNIGSDNGLSPGRRQAIIWTNVRILSSGPLGTNFSEILTEIHRFSFKKMNLKRCLENGGHFVSASMCQLELLMTCVFWSIASQEAFCKEIQLIKIYKPSFWLTSNTAPNQSEDMFEIHVNNFFFFMILF